MQLHPRHPASDAQRHPVSPPRPADAAPAHVGPGEPAAADPAAADAAARAPGTRGRPTRRPPDRCPPDRRPEGFLASEAGAVTVDWVVLTAAIVGLGIAVASAFAQTMQPGGDNLGTYLTDHTISTTF